MTDRTIARICFVLIGILPWFIKDASQSAMLAATFTSVLAVIGFTLS